MTRWSGVVCALALGSVAVANFDLLGLIPIPIVAGLVLNLGYTFFGDALWRPYTQRAWFDLLLCVGIAAVCVQYGYLIGVLAGLVCSCTLFALNYARLGAVQRHVTRAQFKSYVDRSPEASEYLREAGAAIHLYWLSGYIFFGSSEGVFERTRSDITASPANRVAYVILDFGMVSGVDTSAVMSLAKLRNLCGRRGIPLVYCSLSSRIRAALERAGFFRGKSQSPTFPDLNLALAWCEDQLLAAAKLDVNTSLAGFESWLQRQLGATVKPADVMAYLERRDTDGSQALYREGEPSDTLDIVATGHLKVEIAKGDGESLRVRRIMTYTVVGEMGFFRHKERAATVSSDGPATLFTLTHANFERMRRERPEVASAFEDFIMRILADRIDFANRQAAALQPIGTTPT